MNEAAPRLVWMDLEMTGLDPETCHIVEVATVVTDSDLNVIAEGPSLVVHQPEDVLQEMGDFVRNLHTRSGLLAQIRASTVTLEEASEQTCLFLREHGTVGASPLCGNSIWKDRAFLERYMPELLQLLHYRMIDVSTVKELVRRWYPATFHAPPKRETHRAQEDILESIAELRWYREKAFAPLSR